jgi:hypothetical protein
MANDVGDLRDRVILVAGTSSGMGSATAMALADTGAQCPRLTQPSHAGHPQGSLPGQRRRW